MTPRETTWREIKPGMYVRDKAGAVWRVSLDFEDRKVVLTGRDRREVRMAPKPPDTAVTVMEPTEAEALATLERDMSAIVLGVRDSPTQGFRCPPLGQDQRNGRVTLEAAKSHLFLFHGVVGIGSEIKTVAIARSLHAEQHADYDAGRHHLLHAFNAHTHTEKRTA